MLAQRAHAAADPNLFFYVHDRLGSVRMVVAYDGTNETVETVNSYTYTPFGQVYGTPDETVDNPFKFTGQWGARPVLDTGMPKSANFNKAFTGGRCRRRG